MSLLDYIISYIIDDMKRSIMSHLKTDDNKTVNVVARITPGKRKAFKEACLKIYKKDYSKVLRAFIDDTIEKGKK